VSLESEDDVGNIAEKAIAALEGAAARTRAAPTPPVTAPKAPPPAMPPSPKKDPLEELAKLAEQLRPEPRGRWRLGPLPLALLALLLVSLGAVAATRLSGRRHPPAKPLLPPDDASSEPPPWRTELPRQVGPSPPTDAPGSATAPTRASGRISDAKAIDEDLRREFGSGRPTIPGPAQPSSALPSWVKEVQAPSAPDAGTGPRKLGGRYGDHLGVRLRSSLDSRLCSSGAVEAILVRPYLVEGALVLPARTLAFGQCSTRGDRFLLEFTRVRLPDGTEAQLEAVALDAIDGKPGVLASRRVDGARGERGNSRDSLGGEIARGAASTMLSAGTSAAGLPGQLANSAGQTAINDRPTLPSATSEDALLLDSKPVVDLFVAQAF
jgi:hypothetical protein